MSNMPLMAKGADTILFRNIRRFHEKVLIHLAKDSKECLRCSAWQIDAYMEEQGKFKDSTYLKTLLAVIEFYIYKKGGTKWTIARAKTDMRGRGYGINQWSKPFAMRKRPHVPVNLSQSIDARLLDLPRREVKGSE